MLFALVAGYEALMSRHFAGIVVRHDYLLRLRGGTGGVGGAGVDTAGSGGAGGDPGHHPISTREA
jgi:hypothetical protein